MCNSPPPDDDARTSSITNNKKRKQQKQTIVSPLKQPSRKTRTKTRKPKFLSLNLQLSLKKMTHQQQQQQQQQLNLFPLHPENLVEDKDIVMHDDHVASFLFDTTTDTTTTLHGLLSTTTTTTTTTTTESEGDPLSPSLSYSGHDHDVGSLVRTAMKGKERDESEERWVCYSEVVEKKEEDVDSSGVGVGGEEDHDGSWLCGAKRKSLALKLDYQEILNAWSDKGPLYVERESPQTVPDLHDTANVLRDRWGSVGNLWTVPEMGGNISSIKVKGGKDNWRMGQREASVLRYKEKRQNRLFSKRIRYEVRKLNAEKRPRLKGRFVKRS